MEKRSEREKRFEMKPVSLAVSNRLADVAELFALLPELDARDAWMLAESPREFVFQPWSGDISPGLREEFSSLVIFGPKFEVRFERSYAAPKGWLREIRTDETGEKYLARQTTPLLRDRDGCLLYEEYFQPDESGFLLKVFDRLCGVESK